MWVLWDVTVSPPQGSWPEILRNTDGWPMESLQDSVCSSGVWNKGWNFKVCHGEWRSLEQRSWSEVLRDIKQGWRVRKSSTLQLHYSENVPNSEFPLLLPSPPSIVSSWTLIPIWKLTRWPRMWNWFSAGSGEGETGCWGPGEMSGGSKRKEEERKAQIIAVMKSAAEQAVELAVDREQRILLQVSLRFLQPLTRSWLHI